MKKMKKINLMLLFALVFSNLASAGIQSMIRPTELVLEYSDMMVGTDLEKRDCFDPGERNCSDKCDGVWGYICDPGYVCSYSSHQCVKDRSAYSANLANPRASYCTPDGGACILNGSPCCNAAMKCKGRFPNTTCQ